MISTYYFFSRKVSQSSSLKNQNQKDIKRGHSIDQGLNQHQDISSLPLNSKFNSKQLNNPPSNELIQVQRNRKSEATLNVSNDRKPNQFHENPNLSKFFQYKPLQNGSKSLSNQSKSFLDVSLPKTQQFDQFNYQNRKGNTQSKKISLQKFKKQFHQSIHKIEKLVSDFLKSRFEDECERDFIEKSNFLQDFRKMIRKKDQFITQILKGPLLQGLQTDL